MTAAFVVMGKLPKPGRVKTRLARRVGEETAQKLYTAFLQDVFALVSEAAGSMDSARCVFSCALQPGESLMDARALVPASAIADWVVVPQGGAALGERIESARSAGEAEGASEVIVLGSDAPTMQPQRLLQAVQALKDRGAERRVVVGPTEDGGYDLIGFHGPATEVLQNIEWSTEVVLEQTRARAQAAKIELVELSMGYDIDHAEDLQRALQDAERHQLAPQSLELMRRALASLNPPA